MWAPGPLMHSHGPRCVWACRKRELRVLTVNSQVNVSHWRKRAGVRSSVTVGEQDGTGAVGLALRVGAVGQDISGPVSCCSPGTCWRGQPLADTRAQGPRDTRNVETS